MAPTSTSTKLMPRAVSKLFIMGVNNGLNKLFIMGFSRFATALIAVVAVVRTVLKILLVEGL